MTPVTPNIVTQNGLKWDFIIGKTICLRVKGQVVREIARNGIVFMLVHFICCMSHHRTLGQGPELRLQASASLSLIK